MRTKLLIALILASITHLSMAATVPHKLRFSQRTDVNKFIQQMVKDEHFKKADLETLFDKVEIQAKVIPSISKPHEAMPWYRYRPIFLTQKRVVKGVDFWKHHKKELQRAEKRFGVPANIIVAILGVETYYGKIQGSYHVIDTLSTLSFNYPPRSKFFRKELTQFLLLCREQKLNPLKPLGSYAGAIGQPQFMPSSYRHYAIDFDGDGVSDLMTKETDVIGSVANYFKENGWKKGGMVVERAAVTGDKFKQINTRKRKPRLLLADLQHFGVTPLGKLDANTKTRFFVLNDKDKDEYWLGLNNFYVITRYNTSKHYAMAVYELSQELTKAMQEKPQTAATESVKKHG